jgi:hypothetical protein
MKNTLLRTLQNGVEKFCRVDVDLTPGKFFVYVHEVEKIRRGFSKSRVEFR